MRTVQTKGKIVAILHTDIVATQLGCVHIYARMNFSVSVRVLILRSATILTKLPE